MVVLGGWLPYVVVDKINVVEDVCKEVSVLVHFSCVS